MAATPGRGVVLDRTSMKEQHHESAYSYREVRAGGHRPMSGEELTNWNLCPDRRFRSHQRVRRAASGCAPGADEGRLRGGGDCTGEAVHRVEGRDPSTAEQQVRDSRPGRGDSDGIDTTSRASIRRWTGSSAGARSGEPLAASSTRPRSTRPRNGSNYNRKRLRCRGAPAGVNVTLDTQMAWQQRWKPRSRISSPNLRLPVC